MITDEIQKRIDAISAAMLAKGLIRPEARFTFNSHAEAGASVHWYAKPTSFYADESEYFRGTIETALADAEAYVAALPSPEEARMNAFMKALGETIDLGKQNNIEVEFVNPLMALMKRLSKNALQHSAPAE
jgi:hypothetical protein